MKVTINGVPTDVDDDATVAALVEARLSGHNRVAVACNGDVVPRSSWTATRLTPGDSLEVLSPTAGG